MTPDPPAGHRVEVDAAGRPVLVKLARTPAGCRRLAGEAAALALLAHPDVVRVVGHDAAAGTAALRLAWVGPHTLATVAPAPPAAVARVLAGVAATVADVHAAGLTHRRVTADHVLLGPDGRPVLTGFAAAVASARVSPADDVAALGDLVVALVGAAAPVPLLPDRRRARPRRDDGLRAALLTLADRAQGDDPRRRPTAAALAAALGDLGRPGRRRGRAA